MKTEMVNEFDLATYDSSTNDQVSASAVAAMIAGSVILFLMFSA